MTTLTRWVRHGLLAIILTMCPVVVFAAPFAAMVMDARTGEVLYSTNADTRLHPASLTKMMTLYLAFKAIENGKASLDSVVTVTAHAANQPPSRLGLRPGQKIQLRYLIRAAAIKSANDAAAAIGDFLGGDEAGIAKMMNQQARAFGMTDTTFKNANGLTREGHLSSARDMAILGRHVIYDYPQYYNLFSRRSADAGMATVYSTNRRFLDAYEGADGIKTGYTVAAGFNLVASAQRGNKRIIASLFGGTSTPQRNAKMAELLDLGFSRAPARAAEPKPVEAIRSAASSRGRDLAGDDNKAVPANAPDDDETSDSLVVSAATPAQVAPDESPRPMQNPDRNSDEVKLASAEPQPQIDAEAEQLARALASNDAQSAGAIVRPMPRPSNALASAEAVKPTVLASAAAPTARAAAITDAVSRAHSSAQDDSDMGAEPVFDPNMVAEGDTDAKDPVFVQSATPQPETLKLAGHRPPKNDTVILANMQPPAPVKERTREVVSRGSASGGRTWGVNVGKFNSQYAAERVLLKTALMESDALGSALRKVSKTKTAFEANFVGMTKSGAELACARLNARATECSVITP